MTEDKPNRALKPDAQPFDEVRIVTVPRFKDSYLSGNEWRISACIEFYRKGVLVGEAEARNVEAACAHVGYHHARLQDDGKGYFAGERDVCDQEGCSERATVRLDLIRGYNRDGGERELRRGGEYRLFCDRHSVRGDCGLEDADINYTKERLK